MPVYVYICPEDARTIEAVFRMGQAPSSIACPCGAAARRHFTVPHITTNPHHLRDENRLRPPGMSEKDFVAEQRADDKAYWDKWDKVGIPQKSELQKTSLEDIVREQQG